MARASKQRPWVLEMQPPGVSGWYHLDAFRDKERAEVEAKLAAKNAPAAKVRVTHFEQVEISG